MSSTPFSADAQSFADRADEPTAPQDGAPLPDDRGDAAAPSTAAGADALAAVWEDRDHGWLEFNRRVLAEALDPRTPLLERAKFLAIFSANLDEFFMKRVAVLREPATPARRDKLVQLRRRLEPMLRQQADVFRGEIVPGLARHGVQLVGWADLSTAQQRALSAHFITQISPALTPLIIQAGHPFPFFSNLSLSLAFVLLDDRTGESVDARVKVPSTLPQWVPVTMDVPAGERRFVRLHEIIHAHADALYPGMRLTSATLFRVTRDTEVELDEDAEYDLREQVREQVRLRRFEPVVRLEFAVGADPRLRRMLQERFSLHDDEVYDLPAELDYTSLFEIAGLPIAELHDTPWTPVTPARLEGEDSIFDVIQAGDLLVHHPYESFDASVERFISDAADDERTVSIKMTVYRVGDDTPFVQSLIRAAEAGKQVACVIELKARFDEARNLHWAAQLERAGAHVTVGDATLKTHAKVALVVRQEDDGLRCYAHVGTGNYHVRTARLYTDLGLLTCDPAITTDIVNLFHHLTGRAYAPAFGTLLVAPHAMRSRFLALIAAEIAHHRAGRPARIIAKMNQLEDPAMIAALCEASQAGVPVDLVVRGFSCLRPGVPGMSESIRVRSVIGRFLEHSRLFYFADGRPDPLDGAFLIGSADWMTRNLSQRVEVVTPVTDRIARTRLWELLECLLADRRQAWAMQPNGDYVRLQPEPEAGVVDGAGRSSGRDTGDPAQIGTQPTLMRRTLGL